MRVELCGSVFQLLPEKALYKEDESLLVIADIHLGKASHFRKAGVAMPAAAQADDYKNLEKLFRKTGPSGVYFLGDLFHSTFNRDWEHFAQLIKSFPSVSFTLIKGNHDIMDHELFRQLNIRVVNDRVETDTLVYSHQPLETDKLNIAGHLHPGICISGQGRQSVRLACFYYNANVFLLPAFGRLTGLHKLSPAAGSRVFAVLNGTVREI